MVVFTISIGPVKGNWTGTIKGQKGSGLPGTERSLKIGMKAAGSGLFNIERLMVCMRLLPMLCSPFIVD